MMHDVPVLVHEPAVLPDAVAVATYPVMAEPPFDAGAAHATPARPSPAVAATFSGADGAPTVPRGVTMTVPDHGLSP